MKRKRVGNLGVPESSAAVRILSFLHLSGFIRRVSVRNWFTENVILYGQNHSVVAQGKGKAVTRPRGPWLEQGDGRR